MTKSKTKIILKILLGIILFVVLGFLLLISFYIYMIYGIHPSDEGSGGLACEYDKNFNVTKAEIMLIQNGKRLMYQADSELCIREAKDFPLN